jgi:hypothetical protein
MDGEPDVTLLSDLTDALTDRARLLAVCDNYYRGVQPISFVPPEVLASAAGRLQTLVVNWPRVIVDSLEQRLDVEGFRVGGSPTADEQLWSTWQTNELDEVSQLVHIDAFVCGCSYVSVGAFDDGSPRVEAETPHEMIVRYEPGTRRIEAALKQWEDSSGTHARLYLPDSVEFYESRPNMPVELVDVVPHKLGEVPIVPFVNRPRTGNRHGESELSDVIPLADAVNKLATDMMVTSEFHAMPRRWATGIQLPTSSDPAQRERLQEEVKRYWDRATAGKTWLAGQGVEFGQFSSADLSNFTNAISMLTGQIAAIAGMPPHYLGVNSDNPASADAIRSAEASLVMRAKRKQRVLGGSWEKVMRLAEAVRRDIPVADLPAEFRTIETAWRDPETPSIGQAADAAVKLKQAEIITPDQALEDLGYTPTQIANERDRRAAAAAEAATATVAAQVEQAQRLMAEQGLSQAAAFAAVGLLAAAQQIAS